MQWSTRSPSAISRSTTTRVPCSASPSSSPVMSRESEPAGGPRSRTRAQAAIQAAIAPFMSAAPRPISTPSRTSPAKGGALQAAASPGGTTSVWPAKQRLRPFGPQPGVEVLDPAEGQAAAGEAERGQPLLHDRHRARVRRRHRRAADQGPGQLDGIEQRRAHYRFTDAIADAR